jgi:hypothetical protein
MAYLAPTVLDAALQILRDATTPVLHLLPSAPANFAAVTANTLGNKASPTITAQADATPNGRQVTIATFTDGTVTATGTGTHWALVDANDSRLLAWVEGDNPQVVTGGNPLSMTSAIPIRIPAAVEA